MTKFPETFAEAAALVRGHCKGNDTPADPVIRLFRKHLAGRRKLGRTPDISDYPPVVWQARPSPAATDRRPRAERWRRDRVTRTDRNVLPWQ